MKDNDTIALFIDADNTPSRKIETVISELAFCIAINIQKSYGIPSICELAQYRVVVVSNPDQSRPMLYGGGIPSQKRPIGPLCIGSLIISQTDYSMFCSPWLTSGRLPARRRSST